MGFTLQESRSKMHQVATLTVTDSADNTALVQDNIQDDRSLLHRVKEVAR